MFKLIISKAEGIVYEGKASILNISTINGQIGILENHAPFVEIVKSGEISFVNEQGEIQRLATSGGWLFVKPQEVCVLVNASEFDFQIDLAKAEAHKAEAEKILEASNLDEIEYVHAKLALEKAINRIRIASKNN